MGAGLQGHFLHVQQGAVGVVVVDGDDRFSRGGVFVLEGHAGDVGAAVLVDGDGHRGVAHGHQARHIAAVRSDGMGAGLQGHFLHVQQGAVGVVVVYRDDGLQHGGGRWLLGGFRGGGGDLGVGEDDLRRGGDARLVHVDLDGIGAGQLIAVGVGGCSPHDGGLPCPALHGLAVQPFAAIGEIVHRHLHREGHEHVRLGHGLGGHIQANRRVRLHAVHRIIDGVGVGRVRTGGVYQPGEGGGGAAGLVLQVESVGRVGAADLHGQGLSGGGRIHGCPIGGRIAVRHGLSRNDAGHAAAVLPEEAQGDRAPDIRRIGGGKAGRHQQRGGEQKGHQTMQMRCAIMGHGVSLLEVWFR